MNESHGLSIVKCADSACVNHGGREEGKEASHQHLGINLKTKT